LKKALIVDDNEQNLYLMQTVLKDSGYDVLVAANGVEALELARTDPPGIIISDILMPVMDGFTLCREWRKDERLQKIPFIFYTATYTDAQDEELALSLGASRFVVKPQVPEAFTALLREVIEERGTSSRPLAPAQTASEETDYYKLYSKTLVRKLEDKMLALEKINRALEQEITARKKVEKRLQKSEERYRILFTRAVDGILILSVNGELADVNESFARMHGYSAQEMLHMTLNDLDTPETSQRVPERMRRVLAGESLIFEVEHYHKDGHVFLLEVSVSLISSDGESFIQCFHRDITERKRAEEQLQHTLDSLRNAVSATIQIMTATVEARDPYTAGHQIRSADLARAIATEMGLPLDKIDAIRMAGSIHDIGKISIPAEILSKPTKLTEIEFSLIKEHSRRGYEILKGVESPWNLAEIAYQHHERMDGSGYPRQLKGGEILIEARIMAVADVVEAMASHRPYRPAQGLDAALEEIEKNKGILYDADAADVCLRLFREKRYELTQG
jgi:PAS domain S-box-containing protein